MKGRALLLTAVLGAALMLASCKSDKEQAGAETMPVAEAAEEDTYEEVTEEEKSPAEELQEEDSAEEEPAEEEQGKNDSEEDISEQIEYPTLPLPEYHYYGPEDWADYADVVCRYLMEDPDRLSESDLRMCTPVVLKVDDSNPKDVKVWGEFWLDGFYLINTSLISNCGGSYPGVAHIDTTGANPTVTKMDFVEDGSDFQPSFDRLFTKAGLKDAYQNIHDDMDDYRTMALSYYINHNGLYITQYQEYGWAPVPIPNAPETRDEDQKIYYVGNPGYTAEFDMRQICAYESDGVDMFGDVNSDEWSDFLIEIYLEDGKDIDGAIKKLRSNLYDESVNLTRNDDITFIGVDGCTSLTSEPPYKDGDKVYVNYLIPRYDHIFVVKISSDYSSDEEKQMTTDGIIEAFLGSMELK